MEGCADGIKDSAAAFLLDQKGTGWSFNYWAQNEKVRTTNPYPDDLDDTFTALSALACHDRTILSPQALAEIATILVRLETQEGGPYRTWLVPENAPPAWRDVDIVANSAIGYFLSLVNIQLPHIESLIVRAIQKETLVSPYYPGPLHVSYFIARYYKKRAGMEVGMSQEKLATFISKRLKDDQKITTLERAMAISSLIYLGLREKIDLTPDIARLLTDLEAGGFQPHAFCIDPMRDDARTYAGASALTAALCTEALILYHAEPPHTRPATTIPPFLHSHVISLAQEACAHLGSDLQASALSQIKKMSDEKITCLAYDFQTILRAKGLLIPMDIVKSLALANLYGWMAYDIYDDMLDGEGDAFLLPSANFFLRSLARIYEAIDKNIPGAEAIFISTMNTIDNANTWEQKNCRVDTASQKIISLVVPPFGDHNNLADRSIGHGMGPLVMLTAIGYGLSSEEYHIVLKSFRHYLIARQLHDDAHDWVEDLLCGRVNSVGAMVIKQFQKKHLRNEVRKTIKESIPELQKIFWEETIDTVASTIHSHIAVARAARGKSHLIARSGFLENALSGLEISARRAIRERDDTLIFLKYYRHNRSPGVRP